MRIDELLIDPGRREFAAQPEADALTERGALQEAQLLDVKLDSLGSTVWFLFDCRLALQIRMGNTAILVAHGLRKLAWDQEPRGTYTAWNVIESMPGTKGATWSLSLMFFPDAGLELQASSAEFYVGVVPGLDESPPDYGQDDGATIRAGVANWASSFEPLHAVFLDPAPSQRR